MPGSRVALGRLSLRLGCWEWRLDLCDDTSEQAFDQQGPFAGIVAPVAVPGLDVLELVLGVGEHLLVWTDPRHHLALGGIIVLLTPNRRSLAAELLGSSWEWFVPPIHVGYFSPRSLQCVGDVADLELLLLTTREGDGAPLLPSLHTLAAYEQDHLPAWHRQRIRDVIAATDGGVETLMAAGGGAAGLGQEIIAVLAAR